MVMPGDNINLKSSSSRRSPARKVCASRFARVARPSAPASSPRSSRRRESQVMTPKISHSSQGLRSPAARPVDERHRRDGQADRRQRRRPDSAADRRSNVHRAALAARRQEVARAVRDPHPQAAARHPRADPADARRAHEARPVGRRRRRDQVVQSLIAHAPDGTTHAIGDAMPKVDVFNLKREKVGRARPLRRRVRRRGEGAALLRDRQGAARLSAPEPRRDKSARRVRGCGKKLYRQKGTGRARQGSIRAPNPPAVARRTRRARATGRTGPRAEEGASAR